MLLSNFIRKRMPKFNRLIVEGACYHKCEKAVEYIDSFIKYNIATMPNKHLEYLGCRLLSPEEVMALTFKKRSNYAYDMSEYSLIHVEFKFLYNGEHERKDVILIPYMEKGNILTISGKKLLVMPVMADKVLSVGDEIIFANITTAKYVFYRKQHTILENETFKIVPLVITELYKNPPKNLPETTKAHITVIHYLLAFFGYEEVVKKFLGFVPEVVYDVKDTKGKIVIGSTGLPPKGWIKKRENYPANKIKFVVDEDKYNPNVMYCLGSILYVIENFCDRLTISQMNDPVIWRRFIGEIILSGEHGIAYLTKNMDIHFEGLKSEFDITTIKRLHDVGVEAKNLTDLLGDIFHTFNFRIAKGNGGKFYGNKNLEVEGYILSLITFNIRRMALEITKEELRNQNLPLEYKNVDAIFKDKLKMKAIMSIRNDKRITSSVEDTTDHLYFKQTSRIVFQESDFIDVKKGEVNTSRRSKMVAAMATGGSILNLPKKNPSPLSRINPYITLDPNDGTFLEDPVVGDMVRRTDEMLSITTSNNLNLVDEFLELDQNEFEGEGDDDDGGDGDGYSDDGE